MTGQHTYFSLDEEESAPAARESRASTGERRRRQTLRDVRKSIYASADGPAPAASFDKSRSSEGERGSRFTGRMISRDARSRLASSEFAEEGAVDSGPMATAWARLQDAPALLGHGARLA